MTSATDELRRLLDERGVEWVASGTDTCWTSADGYPMRAWDTTNGTHMRIADLTPEQAIAATLGGPTWRNSYDQQRYDQWYNSLFHGEPSSLKELIEDVIWTTETVDLGPNGNECQGVDEGEVQTESMIATWAEKAAALGRGTLTAEDVRSFLNRNSVFDDTIWAHGRQELVFDEDDLQAMADELNATLGRGTCVIESTRYIESDMPDSWYELDLSCGHTVKSEQVPPNYCEECGKRIDLQGVSYA